MSETLLTGRAETPDLGTRVTAGPLTALVLDGDLRRVTVGPLDGGIEIVQRIYLAVRDLDWNTIPQRMSRLTIDAGTDSFAVRYTVRATAGALDVETDIEILGSPDGTISYAMRGRALSSFPFAKIGLCVHHPVRGFAGGAYTGGTPVGPIEGELPDAIGPQIHLDDGTDLPLFEPASQLTIRHASGGNVSFAFEGELWEMEDQRNWTDDSYKSASTPASLGYHHLAEPGRAFDQRIVVTQASFPMDAATPSTPPAATLGLSSSVRLPAIGLGVSTNAPESGPHGSETPAALELLGTVAPAHLRVDVSPADELALAKLASAAATAEAIGARLEIALTIADPSDADVGPISTALLALGDRIARVLVFSEIEPVTDGAFVDTLRAASGLSVPAVSGTNVYFNHINRARVNPQNGVGVAWSINPQVHAFDDLSILENLNAQPDTVTSGRRFAPNATFHLTPITLRPRFNAVAVTLDRDAPPAPPLSDDRQASLLAAAWTLGSVAALTPADVASLTYFETSGPRGVLDASGPFPVSVVLADAAALAGLPVRPVSGIDPARISVVAAETATGTVILAANLTREPLVLRLAADGPARAVVRTLDAESWPGAAVDLGAFLASSAELPLTDGVADVPLSAYATTRLEFVR